jgi:hypothetical protein
MSNANEPMSPVLAQSAGSYEAVQHMGLTKREYFAAMAMQASIQFMNPMAIGKYRRRAINDVVRDSIDIADALLAELERTKC